ncbi:MAG TPA: rhodanese-like domain-containing protein [Burkholderiaceae bacterium]|nr:rhodanese-like domain-containing protein [Burkholderiaceae bacterium]
MNFLLQNWYLVLAALVSGGLLLWLSVRGKGGPGSVSTAEAVRLINREKAVLIDVSEPEEFAQAHAANSRNVPFGQIESTNPGARGLPSNKALPLVVVCPSGARAQRAVAILKKLGYEKSSALAGGLRAWREANLPVESSAGG